MHTTYKTFVHIGKRKNIQNQTEKKNDTPNIEKSSMV